MYLAGHRAPGDGVTILSYHSIDDYGTPLSVSPSLFRAQMGALANEGCVTLTMSEVSNHLLTQRPFPRGAMAITFDDGFENVLISAAPIMQDYGFAATVYIITGMVGRTTQWTDRGAPLPEVRLLSWSQIGALKVQGFEIGAHSVTHGFLSQYSPDDLRRELMEPFDTLYREIGSRPLSFAYPQGDYSHRVVASVREAGYTTAVTVNQGRATPRSDPFTLPRILVSGNTTPSMMRAFSTPATGPAYLLINFVIKRLLGHKRWPRRAPGEIDSTQSVEK